MCVYMLTTGSVTSKSYECIVRDITCLFYRYLTVLLIVFLSFEVGFKMSQNKLNFHTEISVDPPEVHI